MKVRIWGCRGSLPAPGPENYRYGGNTSCIQVTEGDTCIILDAGSGIMRLGRFLGPTVKEVHILLTHLHIDHTMGLGFFQPLYNPNVKVHLWGPSTGQEPLLHRLRRYFSPPLFPVKLSELPMHPEVHELGDEEFSIGGIKILSQFLCHPGPTLGYRLTANQKTLAYIPDHEVMLGSSDFPHDPEWTSGFEIANGADLLFHDGAYSSKEYVGKMGWGHSSIRDALLFANMCKVKKLSIFHHEPTRTDEQIESMYRDAVREGNFGFEIEMCAEGNVYEL
ncbi:MBL fold metallo-hydrolase [Algoriphagus sp. AK58]|uniref:MBL fold metallo-hydrolase n=1 Tax=Algoriphagus sp. AK58 TaxID=1406877 RepID=UPI001650183F|nr:MBL fold metallo-hydrolase [Algoriphagus sp. AK58]MBC6367293.1 MBL fold metallo-hydrolase [Algoriphagus sp. AK58]